VRIRLRRSPLTVRPLARIVTNSHMGIQDRKAREFQRREADLLQAALALSNRDDWQTVTIDQIAQKAEIGKGTVYKHFASKDDIYARLAIDFHRLVLRRLRSIDPSASTAARLRDVLRVFWEVYSTHTEYQRVVEYCERPDFKRLVGDAARRQMQELEAGFAAVIQEIVKQGIAEGLLPNRPVPLVLFGAQAALVGALKLLWIGSLSGPKEQYLEELTAFVLAGLTRPARTSTRTKRPA
jgi:AcrR family transcriptional regulator